MDCQTNRLSPASHDQTCEKMLNGGGAQRPFPLTRALSLREREPVLATQEKSSRGWMESSAPPAKAGTPNQEYAARTSRKGTGSA